MKTANFLFLPSMAAALLVSCDIHSSLPNNGGYNPLNPPGAGSELNSGDHGSIYTAGAFLQTISPTTAFFAFLPKGTEAPTKVLPLGTDVKVISTKGSYVKVELVNTTGEVGYIPDVMLGVKRSPNEVPVTPAGGLGEEAPPEEIPEMAPPGTVDPSRPSE